MTDRRLVEAYHEANQLDEAGIEAICPLYFELSEVETRYRDQSFLAKGGTKEVSRVFDSRTKRWLAMARPRPDLGPERLDRFVHEAWLTSSLVHPNIINIYDVGVDTEGHPYFTMDLKSDRTLAGQLDAEQEDPLSERDLLVILVKICDAVSFAHSRGVLHLDLKPDNIQIDRFGEVLVCDWGSGKLLGDEEFQEIDPMDSKGDGELGMTLDGEIKGTPGFMAPEQAEPDAPHDGRTDVFALGCMLYSILTRGPVFSGQTPDQILRQTREDEITRPSLRYPDRKFPASLEAVTMRALMHRPSKRYASVNDLKTEVARYLAGYTTAAENPGFTEEIVSFVRRNQLASAISLLALIGLTVLSVLFVQGVQRHQAMAAQQHDRAEQLQSKAQSLEQTTETLTARIDLWDQDRADLAEEIASSCMNLDLGMIRGTASLETHEQVSQLATVAHSMNPESLTVERLRFRLACHQMNFAKAEELLPVVGEHVPPNQAWIVGHFREFAFDRNSRPGTELLISFLEEVNEKPMPDPTSEPYAFLDTLLTYDVQARQDPENYEPIIRTFLNFINPDWNPRGFRHDREERFLALRFTPPFRFDTYDEGQSVLRHLNLRKLRLESDEVADLTTLDGLMIESLDLRACPMKLANPIQLPGLLELHVEAGQVTTAELRRLIRSEKSLRIIEHTIGS
ncbi:protein kinase domain-containing protein [Haloferula sp.]|uniref:protein kinase domain-containing protein n=1 Tax=Haloferula sp. TaxID=2497595 RepID=UPI00329FBEF9